ncbi:MAG TPA: FCD domain-containing protein [Acidimicrobiales bacterium]|nr:FCD domain-containing protein [Acidimicrobiales bacterium]
MPPPPRSAAPTTTPRSSAARTCSSTRAPSRGRARDLAAEGLVEAAPKAGGAAFLEADRAFHLTLLGAFGNRRLVELVSRLRDQARLFGVERLAREHALETSAGEHRRIVEAIRARDTEQVTKLVTDHLRHTRGIWAGVDEHSSS